jgi:hypothetical protein
MSAMRLLKQVIGSISVACLCVARLDIENVIEEVEEVLELWNSGAQNPVVFPDEPRSMTATRNVSQRRWLAQKH